ncbi:HlyD family type I secretion periplasmic adaptor subunit [Ferrimonas futtsuensis]|uniref:HlyD family type I secretion periplasmic adaptor subunit n=1 Tax=Ferrimonas futtsuensis TaxID=364764 RepID=UPI00042088EC|nr:HlyD family type I secretion periplasmic adaptor subunit [Ferrimonas futtsuensis]
MEHQDTHSSESQQQPSHRAATEPANPARGSNVPESDLQFTSDRMAVVLESSPKGARLLLWGIALFVVVALVWANFAELDEVAVGMGKVIPSKQLQVVQNLEGGIVEAILVKEGDQVEAGQPLLRLDDTQFKATFRENEQAYDNLRVIVARLKDEASILRLMHESHQFRAPDLQVSSAYLNGLPKELNLLVAREREVLEGKINNLEAGLDVFSGQIDQKRDELIALKNKGASLKISYELAEEEIELKRPLVIEGVVSQIEFLQDQRSLNDLNGEREAIRLSIPMVEKETAELIQKQYEMVAKARSDALSELSTSESELNQMEESRVGLEDKLNRTLVVSPMHGIIQTINVSTLGGVVQPGMNLVEIVPLEGNLLVEARIKPEDIAFIRTGLDAVVKLTAYDFAIYGGLHGKVVHVSPDTVIDEEGRSFYLVRVETDRAYLGPEANPLPIITGMMTSVDILTGKKSVLDYLLKPINRARANALRER